MKVPATEQAVADAWATWASHQHLRGGLAVADYANPDLMNRYTWYRTYNWSKPYPGDSKVYLPKQGAGGVPPVAGGGLTPG